MDILFIKTQEVEIEQIPCVEGVTKYSSKVEMMLKLS